MPNWVTNVLRVFGDKAKETLDSLFTQDEFDFNKVIPMPNRLNIESGSKNTIAMELYLAERFDDIVDEDRTKIGNELAYVNGELKAKGLNPITLDSAHIKELREEHKENLISLINFGKQNFENLRDFGHRTWYEWANHHWGTKWNACETNRTNYNEIIFVTAWAPPYPVIRKLAELYPNVNFEFEFAEEQTGYWSGRIEIEQGSIVEEMEYPEYSKEAFEKSFELCGGEEFYEFDEESGTYKYKEEED